MYAQNPFLKIRFMVTVLVLILLATGGPTLAQSVNLDIGLDAGTPSDTYAGAGLAGVWNNISEPSTCGQPLIGLDGTPTTILVDPCPLIGWWPYDHPETTGDDERLLDDYVGVSDFATGVTFTGLENGRYLVITYGWKPDQPESFTIVFFPDTNEGRRSGGPWPGHLAMGVTHSMVDITVTDGSFEMWVAGGFDHTGGFNGIQLVYDDCNLNGVPDDQDVAEGTSNDCNQNVYPDECEPGGEQDCNFNGYADLCDLYFGTSEDCNDNDIPDDCDIDYGTSENCDGNDIPDECQDTSADCNGNANWDACDIADGTSENCDGNEVPDECQDTSADCNGNADWDACDIADGTSEDCNANANPDECDIDIGTSEDCTGNLIPDECEPDCNGSGAADSCDILDGTSTDANGDGVPDECEFAPAPETGGPTCVVATDCTDAYVGADCIAGRCYVPKNRYLSIDPTADPDPAAYQVKIIEAVDYPGALGRSWWAGEPLCYDYPNGEVVENPPGGDCSGPDYFGWVSKLSDVPVTRNWTEAAVHITGCGVAPAVAYEIRASHDEGTTLSTQALTMSTAHHPQGDAQSWGDITGGPVPGMPGVWLPPERSTNFGDVGNAIRTFENRSGDSGYPPRIWVDVEINQVINLADVQFVVSAFEGNAYTDLNLPMIGVNPSDCP